MPDAPKSLTNNPSITNAAQIGFSWSDGDSSGGASIMYYTIYFDNSDSTWQVLEPTVSQMSYTTQVTLVKGRLYSFKVQAINSVGVSLLSTSLSILAAQIPA